MSDQLTFAEPAAGCFALTGPQADTAARLAAAEAFLVGHDMGTGKTAMCCDAIRRIADTDGALSVLVIAPKNTARGWLRHVNEHGLAGPHTAHLATGAAANDTLDMVRDGGVAVTSWETMRMRAAPVKPEEPPEEPFYPPDADAEEIDQIAAKHDHEVRMYPDRLARYNRLAPEAHRWTDRWDVVVADEAHRAKNPTSQQARSLAAIRADRRWALTGTPVANEPTDFWAVLHWLDPARWPKLKPFLDRYAIMSGGKAAGWSEHLPELMDQVGPMFAYAPRAELIGRSIARRRDEAVVGMSEAQADAYRAMWNENIAVLAQAAPSVQHASQQAKFQARVHGMTAVMALDRICQGEVTFERTGTTREKIVYPDGEVVWAKRDRTRSTIRAGAKTEQAVALARRSAEPMVMMAESSGLVNVTHDAMLAAGVNAVKVVGGMTSKQTAAVYDAFQSGRHQVLLATVGTSGEGIDLTAAARLVWIAEPWSLIKALQGEGRIDRFSQPADEVRYTTIITTDRVTIECPCGGYEDCEECSGRGEFALPMMDAIKHRKLEGKRHLLDAVRGSVTDQFSADASVEAEVLGVMSELAGRYKAADEGRQEREAEARRAAEQAEMERRQAEWMAEMERRNAEWAAGAEARELAAEGRRREAIAAAEAREWTGRWLRPRYDDTGRTVWEVRIDGDPPAGACVLTTVRRRDGEETEMYLQVVHCPDRGVVGRKARKRVTR